MTLWEIEMNYSSMESLMNQEHDHGPLSEKSWGPKVI